MLSRKVEELDLKKPTKLKDAKWDINLDDWDYDNLTIVQFKPDATIFETTDFDLQFFKSQIREYAYLTAGVKFELLDHRSDQKYTFYFEGE